MMMNDHDYGLEKTLIQKVNRVFSRYPDIDEVVIYGSRAKGNFKPGSDIDLTLKGKGIDLQYANKIRLDLDELLTPYTFDISVYDQIDNADLIDHIKRVGKVLYKGRK